MIYSNFFLQSIDQLNQLFLGAFS